MYNKAIECIEKSELNQLQLQRLQETLRNVYDNMPYYRKKMDAVGVRPHHVKTLADIKLLPFTDKEDLRQNYPFNAFAAPIAEIIRVHASSGTTGKPTTVGYTKGDIDAWAHCCARAIGCANGTNKDIVQISYGYGLFTGGLGLHYGAEKLGATTIPISSGNTARQLMLMQDYQTNILCCTPSYALMMGEAMKEQNIDRKKLALRAGIFGAEPWSEGMRSQIEELWGIHALDIYGLSETMGPGVAMECVEAKNGMHVWEDNFIIEIIDPKTGQNLKNGETGELVITTINKSGMPTLRYRTHDLTSIVDEPCVCKRTHRKISRLMGRTDDMLIIRGINVFPSQIEEVLSTIVHVLPHYMIIVDRVHNCDTIEVQVELVPEILFDEVRKIEGIRNKVAQEIQTVLGLSVSVKLVAPKSIERSEGKAKRLIDKRR